MDSQTAVLVVALGLLVVNPPKVSRSLVMSLAATYAAWSLASSFGMEADGAAVLATLIGLRAAYRLFQIVLTLLATFPLQLLPAIAPLEVAVPRPAVTQMPPPVSVVLSPALSVMSPPAARLPLPTERLMSPPLPLRA